MLILVRHGETEANAAGVLLGQMESPLTAYGQTQVARLGPAVVGARRLISSPLGRARATAAALGLDLPVEIDERWAEIHYGELDGQPLSALPLELLREWRGDPRYRPPGGESLAELGVRVRDACTELFGPDGGRIDGDVVVVSHVSPIKAAVAWAIGVGDEISWRLQLSTASITRIGWAADRPVLRSFNDTLPD